MTLRATNLSFAYRAGTPVLRGVDAGFEPGSVTAIVGPNGSGKTTLLRLLLGLLAPTSGSVTLDGRRVQAMREPARAARLSYVPQRPSVAFGFSVLDVVALGCGTRTPAAVARRAAAAALEAVGLAPRASEPLAELSAGQQQRAVLARALAQLASSPAESGPGVLLADEPTSAMDPRHALEAMEILRAQARQGRIVVVVLHDLTAALRGADRAVVLDSGGQVRAADPVGVALRAEIICQVFDTAFAELTDPETGVRALVPHVPASDRYDAPR